ncbi:hypothetical protein PABG_07308 [Paracoccidioides brasiliensis Pb03]|nr:hypothetical protein PABG_07308 [Paracoccidioides brasiliensis Pb03]
MPPSPETEGSEFSTTELEYADDMFSDHSDDNTDRTEETDSQDSEDSHDSDEEISEDNKLPSLEYYKVEETTLDSLQTTGTMSVISSMPQNIPLTLEALRYCEYMRRNNVLDVYWTLSIQSFKGFLSGACDQCRGKGGRRWPGIQAVSSLGTFWKQFSQIYKQATGDSINPLIMAQARNVIELIADEEKLSHEKRPGEPMYVGDLAEYLHVLLVMNEMEFLVSRLRGELILFCQVTGITGSQPDALTQLQYHDLEPMLVRDPHISVPHLCVGLTAHFTKTFLGMNYVLRVLNGLNQQKLSLQDDLTDQFIFCSTVHERDSICITHEIWLTKASVQTRMKKSGEIIGFQQVSKLVSTRAVIIHLFFPPVPFSRVNMPVDVGIVKRRIIYHGRKLQKVLKRMLMPEQSRLLNYLARILKTSWSVKCMKKRRDATARWLHSRMGQRYSRKTEKDRQWEDKYRRQVEKHERRDERYHKAVRRLRSEKQRPVINSKRQLSGKVIDKDVRGELEQSEYMTPEQISDHDRCGPDASIKRPQRQNCSDISPPSTPSVHTAVLKRGRSAVDVVTAPGPGRPPCSKRPSRRGSDWPAVIDRAT